MQRFFRSVVLAFERFFFLIFIVLGFAHAAPSSVSVAPCAKFLPGFEIPDVVEYGADDAPYEVHVYFSPTCSHCAHFFKEDLPFIKSNYILKKSPAQVKFFFYILPLTAIKGKLRSEKMFIDAAIARICMLANTPAFSNGKDGFFDKLVFFSKHQKEWFPDTEKEIHDVDAWKKGIKNFAVRHRWDADIVQTILNASDRRYEDALLKHLEKAFDTKEDGKTVIVSPVFYVCKKGAKESDWKRAEKPLTSRDFRRIDQLCVK